MPAVKLKSSSGAMKVPTILGSLLLLIGVGLGVYLVQQQLRPDLQATPQTEPRQVEISNITDTSFVVSWSTQEQTTGLVSYGDTPETTFIARDKRDVFSDDVGNYTTHWVEMVNLRPETTYYFYLQSGGVQFDQGGQPYQVVTGPSLPADQAISGFGQVNTPDGNPAPGSIVLVTHPQLGTLSTLSDESGKWTINFAISRDPSSTNRVNVEELDQLTLLFNGGTSGNSTVRVTPDQISPLADVQLGNDYDFTDITPPNDEISSQFSFVDELGAQGAQGTTEITIWNPQEDEALSTDTPLFIGLGPVEQTIQLTLDPATTSITGETTTDERGNWQWAAPQPLSTGQHALLATYTDDQGVEYQASRVFTILASATGPAIESTPSATTSTPTPSPTTAAAPTTAPTSTPTTAPTSTPTRVPTTTPSQAAQEVSPTVTPTPTVAATATPTAAATATPTQVAEGPTPTPSQLPDAGATLPTAVISGLGVILVVASLLFIL